MTDVFTLLVIVCNAQLASCQMVQGEPKPTIAECHELQRFLAKTIMPGWRVVGQGECAIPFDLSSPKGTKKHG